ncbi:hypothetical protein HGI47_21050 [Novosphingobium sp. ERN07]|uniref:hypothetical protein n=1 Tax=Novosphingobium sp. ERN07 TaxID=2726187 RepID=UPI00145727F8|nr:hypothetical protein [Novosphingobium sp. ERN07]NLR73362.1 hypothetical protein [Novosphingobium sp. ERN07]
MLAGGLILLGLLVWFAPIKGSLPPIPLDVQGCFRSKDLPDIEVGAGKMRILQSPELSVSYALEYHKGWAYSLDQALRIEPEGSTAKLTLKSGHGLFLFLSREGAGTAPIAQFTLYSSDGARAAIYKNRGSTCASPD